MTTTKPATPLPWKYGELSESVISLRGQLACSVDDCGADAAQNAAYIVHACNAYPELVAALREIQGYAGLLVPTKDSPDAAKRDHIMETIRDLLAKLGEDKNPG